MNQGKTKGKSNSPSLWPELLSPAPGPEVKPQARQELFNPELESK